MTSTSTSSRPPSTSPAQPRATAVGESPQADGAQVKAQLHGRIDGSAQVRVAMSQAALRQVQAHSSSDLDKELGGALLGQVSQQDGTHLVTVQAALPMVSRDHGPVHFTFTADAWAQLQQDKANRYPSHEVVGWYHTHPGLGVFFSADDMVVHSAAFVLPWHVALVVDPVAQQAGLFAWQPSGVDAKPVLGTLAGFEELLDEEPESVVSWAILRADIRPDLALISEAPGQPRVTYPANEWPSLPQISPWWGVALGGTSLLISLILLLDRLLTGGN